MKGKEGRGRERLLTFHSVHPKNSPVGARGCIGGGVVFNLRNSDTQTFILTTQHNNTFDFYFDGNIKKLSTRQ